MATKTRSTASKPLAGGTDDMPPQSHGESQQNTASSEEETAPPSPDTSTEGSGEGEKPPTEPPVPEEGDGQEETVPPQAEEPDYVRELLKIFSSYAALYIDRQGGTYTADTAAHIRKGAVLYTNPNHEP